MISPPPAYGLVARLSGALGHDLDTLVPRFTRTIRSGTDEAFLPWIRRRPPVPLLTVLRRRLARFPAGRLRRRAVAGDELAGALPSSLLRPGSRLRSSHWLFPVVLDDPAAAIAELRRRGFDATQGTSEIAVVEAPPERPEVEAPRAHRTMAGMVFVPAYPEIGSSERQRLAAALRACAGRPRAGELRAATQ